MTIQLCTLVLNEMEWLPKLYEQHKDWPGLVKWVFVEAADRVYAETNPEMVDPRHFPVLHDGCVETVRGLSIDGTREFLFDLAQKDSRVTYIPHGICRNDNPAQGKCEARQRYLDEADVVKPDFLYVLDADEFYCKGDQRRITELMAADHHCHAFMFRQRHIWWPPFNQKLRASILSMVPFPQPMYREVVGGYWSIPHCRGWQWQPGLKYAQNHNWPEDKHGRYLTHKMQRYNRLPNMPECVHMGYASSFKTRKAKHDYYIARGEGSEVVRNRSMYVECRAAWERWKPGDLLPHGAGIREYQGPIPEVFR